MTEGDVEQGKKYSFDSQDEDGLLKDFCLHIDLNRILQVIRNIITNAVLLFSFLDFLRPD